MKIMFMCLFLYVFFCCFRSQVIDVFSVQGPFPPGPLRSAPS